MLIETLAAIFRRHAGLVLGLSISISALHVAGASAATVSVSGTQIIFQAAAGETNRGIEITHPGANYQFDQFSPDTTDAPLDAGAGCTDALPADPDSPVTCPDTGAMTVVVNLEDGQDTASAAGLDEDPFTMNGGDGNDMLTLSDQDGATKDVANGGEDSDGLIGGAGENELNGGPARDGLEAGGGDDTLNAGAGNDNLLGEGGDDTLNGGDDNSPPNGFGDRLVGGPGDDDMRGGGGVNDVADYSANTAAQPIAVTLGTTQSVFDDSDGLGGMDSVGGVEGGLNDIEKVISGAGGDTIDASGNGGVRVELDSRQGQDTLTGSDFAGCAGLGCADFLDAGFGAAFGDAAPDFTEADTVNGGAGNDSLQTEFGPDTLDGGPGDDALAAGDGDDMLDAGPGDDTVGGGGGHDRMRGRDGGDSFLGGDGIDRVLYDDHTQGVTVDIAHLPLPNPRNDGNAAEDGPVLDDVDIDVESVTGSPQDDTLTGNCRNNTLAPINGDDTVNGDPATCNTTFGRDFMGGANGAGTANGNDTFNGLGGLDSVTFTHNSSTQGIDVDIDGAAGDPDGFDDDDGIGGEDNIQTDIERVFGGAGDDTINADFAAVAGVTLFGRAGNDTLTGSDSNDFLDGEADADTLDCQGGMNDMYRHDGLGPAPVNCETLAP